MSISRFVGAAGVATLALTALASAQDQLYAVDFPGNLYRVNTATGAATLVAATGFNRLNAAAASAAGAIYASRLRDFNNPADVNQLIRIDPTTGIGTLVAGYGTLNDLRGLAFDPGGRLYGIREAPIDELLTIDPSTGAVTLIGPTAQNDVQGLTFNAAGELFGVGVMTPGKVYRIDTTTGAATLVANPSGGIAPGELQTVEWIDGARAVTGRSALWTLDLASGASNMIGPFGVADVRGLAAVRAPRCYADCDQNNALNVNDFICFQAAFAAGASYADCDQNSALNVNDFICFQSSFAAGCP